MRVPHWNRTLAAGAAFALSMSSIVAAGATAQLPAAVGQQSSALQPAGVDWSAVEQALGKSGQMMAGDVFRIGMPRSDLQVSVAGVPVQAGFALGSYAASKLMDSGQTMVMGDLVLLDEEVPGVMSGLFANGLEVTALHNHLNQVSPHVMYLHYMDMSDPVELAGALRQALSASPVTMMGMPIPPAMGVTTSLNFQPTDGGKAAITGDFVLTQEQVNPVASALRSNGIEVTAVHNHGLDDQPRLFYLHFWAHDEPTGVTTGLRAALDQVNAAAPQLGPSSASTPDHHP